MHWYAFTRLVYSGNKFLRVGPNISEKFLFRWGESILGGSKINVTCPILPLACVLTLHRILFTESAIDTFFTSYFYLCLELVLETWDKTMLTQAFNGQGSLTSGRSSWLKSAYSSWNGASTREEEWFLCPFVVSRREMVYSVATKPVLQPAKTAGMCMSPCAETHSPLPISPFLLDQNLSSKQIASTNNMWPKSDNAKKCHQWLNGLFICLFVYLCESSWGVIIEIQLLSKHCQDRQHGSNPLVWLHAKFPWQDTHPTQHLPFVSQCLPFSPTNL